MPTLPVVTGTGPARGGVTLMCRLIGQGGQQVTPLSIASVAYSVTDLTAGAAAAAGALTPAAVLFADLQQADRRWTQDSSYAPGPDGLWGYNFRWTVPAATFVVSTPAPATPAARDYQIDVRFTPADGSEPFVVTWRVTALPAYGV